MSRKPNGPVTSSFSWPRWFKAAATISTFLVLIMLPRAAWAQRVKSDPNPDKPCVTKLAQTDTMYRVAFHPYCDLRELVRTFPVLNEAGKPLPMQEQLRNIFEANKDREVDGTKVRHTVMRGCVMAGAPSPNADQEELQYCPNGLVNYFAAPANDSIAIIEVPRSKLLTYTEKLEKLSATACKVLETAPNPDILVRGVLANCHKLGIQTLAQVAPVVADEQPQSTPPQTQSSATQTAASASASTSAPAASASSAPKADVKSDAKDVQLSKDDTWLNIMAVSLILLSIGIIVLGWLFWRERDRNMAPIKAGFEKKVVEIQAASEKARKEFEAAYDHTNVALTTKCAGLQAGLDKCARENERLTAKLNEQRSQPTQPPSGQLAKDNEKLANKLVAANAEVANLNAKVTDLEAKLAQASTIVPTGDVTAVEERIQNLEFDVCAKAGEIETLGSRIDQLKKSLDTVTGERNQAQGKLEDLEKEIGQVIQSRTASNARAEQAKANQTSVEDRLTAVQIELDELKRKPATTTPGLDGAEVIAANLRATQAEEKCKALVAEKEEKDAKIAELEARIAQNGAMPQFAVVSVQGYENTIRRLGEEIKTQVNELAEVNTAVADLKAQLEQSQSDVKAKDLSLAEKKCELKKTEEDLALVGEANASLVSELRTLRERLAEQQAISTVKLAQDPPTGDPISTVKLAEASDSTQDGKSTPEGSDPQAKRAAHESDVPGLARMVEQSLGPFADQSPDIQDSKGLLSPAKENALRDYVASDRPQSRDPFPTLSEALPVDEQLTHPRMAVLPPLSKDVTDTIPPRPSSPPPVDFDTMPDEILNGIFRSSLMQVGLRRLNGMRCFTFEVTGRDDIYRIHEAINAPLIWSINDQKMQHEFGSPRLLIDCQGLECKKPQSPMTKTAAMPGIGG
ncbi:MAG: hypothetical protein WCW31_03055 [Patescibacteria group bacterium]